MTAGLDLAAVKDVQQRMWASGDYAAVGRKIVFAAELLVEAADIPAGSLTLDVAAGTGNAALAAARSGCRVVALDYVPELLGQAAVRAAAEGVALEVVEGDAEALPFEDASFDAVVSVFGVMFCPDQARAAGELTRVCRPGGRIGLASWTPEGFVGDFFRLLAGYAPPPPGLPAPSVWGTEDGIRELLGPALGEVRAARRTCALRFASPEAMSDYYFEHFGPVRATAAALDEEGRAALHDDLSALARRGSSRDDCVSIPAEYLEVVATRS